MNIHQHHSEQLRADGRIIEAGWNDLLAELHPHATLDELLCMRGMFFAGANHLFLQFLEASRGHNSVTLEGVGRELHDFHQERELLMIHAAGSA